MVAFHREKNLQIMFIIALISCLQLEASSFCFGHNGSDVTPPISNVEDRLEICRENVNKPCTMTFTHPNLRAVDEQSLLELKQQYSANSFSVHDKKLVTDTVIHCLSVFVSVAKGNEDELKKTQEALANHEALLAESTKNLNESREQNIELQMKLTFMQSEFHAIKNTIAKYSK
ncbi:MAG: hypothetical protein Q8Q60_03795 [Candidatus Chromulinivorax sp.]|nr:hypothetical protein [Candidatus Chromulinivorax sp.]